MSYPLSGIKVVDFTRLLPGPLCSLHLADLGAEVIKVEFLPQGDYSRWIDVPLFEFLNRNKTSVFIDPESEKSKLQLFELVKNADVLIESFRPGYLKKFGIAFDQAKALNPQLIYCSITGFGQSGPMANKAGHDINFLALSGVLDQMGKTPQVSNFQVADILGAQAASFLILAAYIGQQFQQPMKHLDVSLTDVVFSQNQIALAMLKKNNVSPQFGSSILFGGSACYNVYQTKDLRQIAMGAYEKKFWMEFCRLVNKPDWVEFHEKVGVSANASIQTVAQLFLAHDFNYWINFFKTSDCCVTPVLSVREACESALISERQEQIRCKDISYKPYYWNSLLDPPLNAPPSKFPK